MLLIIRATQQKLQFAMDVNSNNRVCLPLTQIPQCIHNVPYAKRKYLSPIYLHTSLGRSAGTNPFVEYRSLTGQMGYSKIEEHLYSTLA